MLELPVHLKINIEGKDLYCPYGEVFLSFHVNTKSMFRYFPVTVKNEWIIIFII